MTGNRVSFYFWLLLPVLFLGLSLGLWAQNGEAENARSREIPPSSENALSRLIEISAQLSTLNERLREELQDSRRSSRELQNMLESSRRELETLRSELEVLHNSSRRLLSGAENSQTESAGLLTALRKAEASLMSLELSFTAYRETAEGRIKTLEREKTLLKWGCVCAGALAAGFGTAYLLAR